MIKKLVSGALAAATIGGLAIAGPASAQPRGDDARLDGVDAVGVLAGLGAASSRVPTAGAQELAAGACAAAPAGLGVLSGGARGLRCTPTGAVLRPRAVGR